MTIVLLDDADLDVGPDADLGARLPAPIDPDPAAESTTASVPVEPHPSVVVGFTKADAEALAPGESAIVDVVTDDMWTWQRRGRTDEQIVEEEPRQPVALRTKYTYRVKRDKRGRLCVVAEKAVFYRGHTGRLPHRPRRAMEGKSYSTWRTEDITIIVAARNGSWTILTYFKPGRRSRGRWYSRERVAEQSLGSLPALLRSNAEKFLPAPATFAERYPSASHYGLQPGGEDLGRSMASTAWAPTSIRRAFSGAVNGQELTRALFGKTRYRRDLVKAVAGADFFRLCLVHQFRGLVPVDWLVSGLRVTSEGRIDPSRIPDLRPILRLLDQNSLKRLLADGRAPGRILIDTSRNQPTPDDLARLREEIANGGAGLGRVRSWEELHDAVTARRRAFHHLDARTGPKRRTIKPVNLPEWACAIETDLPSGLRIVLAREEDTLWHWGTAMNNCIGGYGAVMRGRIDKTVAGNPMVVPGSLLGGIYGPAPASGAEGDRPLLGNFEIAVDRYPRASGPEVVYTRIDPDAPIYDPAQNATADQDSGDEPPREVSETPPGHAILRLQQLLGRHNNDLPSDLRDQIVEQFNALGVDCRRYWGQGAPVPGQEVIHLVDDADDNAGDDE